MGKQPSTGHPSSSQTQFLAGDIRGGVRAGFRTGGFVPRRHDSADRPIPREDWNRSVVRGETSSPHAAPIACPMARLGPPRMALSQAELEDASSMLDGQRNLREPRRLQPLLIQLHAKPRLLRQHHHPVLRDVARLRHHEVAAFERPFRRIEGKLQERRVGQRRR